MQKKKRQDSAENGSALLGKKLLRRFSRKATEGYFAFPNEDGSALPDEKFLRSFFQKAAEGVNFGNAERGETTSGVSPTFLLKKNKKPPLRSVQEPAVLGKRKPNKQSFFF